MLDRLRHLYEGHSPAAHRFRYALLGFDLITVIFVVVTSFFPRSTGVEVAAVRWPSSYGARCSYLQRLSPRAPARPFTLRCGL